MADWTAFATSFLRDSAGYINDRKDKAEDYADKLREQAERNKSKLGKLKQAAKAQQGFISQARGLYASDAQIEAALDAGPTGLRDLVSELSSLKTKYGNYYDEQLVTDYAKLPEGFKATGNLDPMTRYGLTGSTVGDIAKPEGSWLSQAMGYDAKSRVRSELDTETVGDTGYSVYDLAQISDVSGYESLNPTSFLAFTAPKIMSPGDVPEQLEDFNTARRTAAIEADRIYDMTMQEIKAAEIDNIDERDAAVRKAQEDREAMIVRSMENFINTRRALYDNYDDLMGDTLDLYNFGTPEVTVDVVVVDEDPIVKDTPQAVAPEEEVQGEGGLMSPPSKPKVVVPEVVEPKEEEPKSVKEKLEKMTGLSVEKQQELIDTGQATEMDFQLVSSSGDDILDFISDNKYALNSMGITEGLSDWADKNNKRLPFNMNFLINFVGRTLRAPS